MSKENIVQSLVIEVEHFPGTVKTKQATIMVTNHKTGESQSIVCKNTTEAMRVVAMNVFRQDMMMLKEHLEQQGDQKFMKDNGLTFGNA